MLSAPPVIAGEALAPQLAAAAQLYADGKAEEARQDLERLAADPSAADPASALQVQRALMEVCLHSRNAACVIAHADAFVREAGRAPRANALQAGRLALEATYYLDQARFLSGRPAAEILADASWAHELAPDGDLYLRRQVLASNLLLQQGERAALDRAVAKILSMAGSLTNPEAARVTVAASLADVLATLLDSGQTERAWGLFQASGADIASALPPLSVDAALYELTEGQLRQQVGDVPGARVALARCVATLRAIELDPGVRTLLLAQALTLEAALDASAGDLAAADAALAEHPYASRYAVVATPPASSEEVSYLAARSLAAALGRRSDPVAAQALALPTSFAEGSEAAELSATYRAAGAALARPPGPDRSPQLQELGRRLRDLAQREDRLGELSRLGAIDQTLVMLALSPANPARTQADADVSFTLFQLAARTGASFDADALTALSQTKDEAQRRTMHQALRLLARRDRLEREAIQRVTAGMRAAPTTGILAHDVARRRELRDADEAAARAEARLARDGLSLRGPRLVSLAKLRAALGPDEAVLAVAPTIGGLAYMCVRHDRTQQSWAAADSARLRLDAKLLQAALTATYAPSEALDAQYPAGAAVRLYDALIRPFESCLQPGDRILWLSSVATAGAPLAALLSQAPPKLDRGYDLSKGDWLVRRHAISYAGSAAAIVAARAHAGTPAEFDFLGVGDPVLTGGLAPLPETKDELEVSARGFRTARVLTQGAATERGWRAEMVGHYRYLSFATHGLLRDDLRGLSDPALVLTGKASGEPADDGLLTASEIADLSLNASFVALSACDTANFDFDRIAQDLPALASAFAVSGVPATLGTLWPVNSRTGAEVVSRVFAGLRAGRSPADAVAEAQRNFLDNPPSRAYLHPRFWAPFVVLGDGGSARTEQPSGSSAMESVEVVGAPGGEVVALARTPQGTAARLIEAPAAAGALASGVRLTGLGGAELWRRSDPGGASRVLAQLGTRLVAGGYIRGVEGRLAPTLQAYDLSGAQVAAWRGEAPWAADVGILASTRADPESLILAVYDRPVRGAPSGGGLHLLRVGSDLAPRTLFDIASPPGARLSNATITPLGDKLLITFSDATTRYDPNAATSFEDYDPDACLRDRVTWVELHDRRTGRLLASRTLEDVAVVAAVAGRAGSVVLGGSRRQACHGPRQAVVIRLDARLGDRVLYGADGLGASEVRALDALPNGRVFAAAYEENLVDATRRGARYSTFALVLDERGAEGLKALDAGSDVIPTALAHGDDGEILLGGSLGGQAAIFRLSPPPPLRRGSSR